MVDLFARVIGEGPPLVMLHGLFGSGDNLGALARGLAESYQIILPDMRNHGRSPHDPVMDYTAMASDVIQVMDRFGLETVPVFGHSMGGKAAMQVALDHPDRVSSLMVGDIAPVAYDHQHTRILTGMQAVAEAAPGDRKAAAEILGAYVEDPSVIGFIMTNWRREKGLDGAPDRWGWRLNLPVIVTEYGQIAAGNDGPPYTGEVLFLRGGESEYVTADHRARILDLFPKADVRTVSGTGHWLHAEKPATVERLMRRFMEPSAP